MFESINLKWMASLLGQGHVPGGLQGDLSGPAVVGYEDLSDVSGYLKVLSVAALLEPYQTLLAQINELAGVSALAYDQLYLTAIKQFARFVQQLPASEVHHHAGPGGLLAHSLEVVCLSLRLRQSYLLSSSEGAEIIAKKADLWTYAVFTAALCHDLAKPALDQRVTVYHKRESVVWSPFTGCIDESGEHYQTAFVPGRVYRLHEKATALLLYRILPATGLQWLHSDPAIFAAWLAAITGDQDQAEAIGAIVSQADGQSVAKNLGASSQRLATATAKPLHEKMLTSMRLLLANGELPLNRNGAAAWVKGDDCWLVSKRVIDAVRLQLTQEGHNGLPTQNSRLYDVLQEHAVLIPCGEKAIWRVTIVGEGWRNELTVIRIAVHKLWPNPETRPEAFLGDIIPEAQAGAAVETATVAMDCKPLQEHEMPVLTAPSTVEPLPPAATSSLGAFLPSVLVEDLPKVNGTDSRDEVRTSDVVVPDAEGETQPTRVQPKPLSSKKPEKAINTVKQLPSDLSDSADEFFLWLQQALLQNAIATNTTGAQVHVVQEGVLLITPGIFQTYAKRYGQDWQAVQKNVLKKNWHSKTLQGLNVMKYQVVGKHKSTSVNGILYTDPGLICGSVTLPKPNPHLSKL